MSTSASPQSDLAGLSSPVIDHGKDNAILRSAESDRASISSSEDTEAGVKTIEAVSQTWTKWSLISAYVGLYLMAFSTSLEGQTTSTVSAFAASSFGEHSLLATIAVVSSVIYSVVKPLMAKAANVFGRLESFSLSVSIFVIGYAMQAGANNVKTFAAAQIFYAAGSTGLQILQQIFVADTSNLLNRALFSSIPDLPFLVTVWIGPLIGQRLVPDKWRWGYGIWAVILPVAFLPLALSLFLNQRKAARLGWLPQSPFRGQGAFAIAKNLWLDLDFFGLVLLGAAISLILIPLTLAAGARRTWDNPSILAMLIIGCVCLVLFPLWELSSKLAPRAFFTRQLFAERTVLAGVAIAFFYFMAFYLSVQPYFYSYLLVVRNQSVTVAGRITQTFSFTATVTAIIISFAIKYTKHYKYYVTLGSCIYLLGIGLMIKYRTETTSIASIVGCQIAVGIGGGMINVPTQLGVQASAKHKDVAAATAVFLTILEIGGAVGSAISGAIWTANLPNKLAAYLPPNVQDQAAAIYGNVTLASQGWPMGSPEREAINRAYQETMQILLTTAVCTCIPLVPLSLLMKNYRLDSIQQNVKGKVIGGSHGEQPDYDAVADGTAEEDASTPVRRRASHSHSISRIPTSVP